MTPFDEAQKLEDKLRQDALIMTTDTIAHHKIRANIRQLYLEAADQGSIPAKAQAALCFAYCIGGPRDPERHRVLVNEAAEAGNVIALGMRAENYWFGENGFPVDLEQCESDAKKAYLADAWLGATVYTWVLRRRAETTQDPRLSAQAHKISEETLPMLLKEAQAGDSIAQDWLAWRYYNGEGLAKDPATAAAWFRLSADNGLAWAQYWLGLRYLQGEGVVQSLSAAQHWFKKAAAQGIEDAMNQLKLMTI